MKRLSFPLLMISLLVGKAFSQSTFIPLNDDSYHYLQRLEIRSGNISDHLHFSALPLQREEAMQFLDSLKVPVRTQSKVDSKTIDYLLTDNDEWSEYNGSKSRKPLLEYFYRDKASFYQHRNNDFMVKVNPVFYFQFGGEPVSEEKLFTNTRGIELRGWVAKKVGYYFLLNENQARFPLYVRERIDSFGAVPGEGYYKDFKTDAVDFFSAKGYFDFKVAKFITIQFGNDKNSLGNGIRSLALSDFSEDYLFLKLQTQVWKISYQNLFVDMTADFIRGGDKLLPKKYGALHHLSINATRFLNIGLWESVVFQRNDGYELNYLNPIIFYRAVEQLLGSPDNTMLGMDARVNFLRHFSVYGQLMIDDLNIQSSKGKKGYWANKYGFQLGAKYIDAFSISHLDLQVEWNYIRPYSYTHNDTVANYSNYNQPLAHPMGANLNEWIGTMRYQPVFPVTVQWSITATASGRDTSGSNWGSDIFIPTTESVVQTIYDNEVGQGVGTNLFLSELSVSWMIRHNIFIEAMYGYRKTKSDEPSFSSSTNIFQVGVRMNASKRRFQF
ncbi:MAG: hypothetical protein ABIO46_09145 [Chitinophagales bacterium]